jgi:hypothetical protein
MPVDRQSVGSKDVRMRKILVFLAIAVYAGIFSASVMQTQAATKIKGSDVLINGDSFFALSGQIKADLEALAREDGSIGSSESFRNAAASGAMLAAITKQYSNASPKPIYVIMDGGGNDVLLTTCPTPPTAEGAQATADAFWKAIKDSNFFSLGTPVEPYTIVKTAPSVFLGKIFPSNSVFLSLFLAQPTAVTIRITAVSGRTVFAASKQEQTPGFQTLQFHLGGIAPGVYCLDVQTGQFSERSSLLVR